MQTIFQNRQSPLSAAYRIPTLQQSPRPFFELLYPLFPEVVSVLQNARADPSDRSIPKTLCPIPSPRPLSETFQLYSETRVIFLPTVLCQPEARPKNPAPIIPAALSF